MGIPTRPGTCENDLGFLCRLASLGTLARGRLPHLHADGYYSPGICPKFSSADGSTVWAFTAGDWTNGAAYKLTAVSLSIK